MNANTFNIENLDEIDRMHFEALCKVVGREAAIRNIVARQPKGDDSGVAAICTCSVAVEVPTVDLQLPSAAAEAIDACQDRITVTLETVVKSLDYDPKDLWQEALATGDESKCEKFARFIASASAKGMASEGAVPEDKLTAVEERLFAFYMSAIKAEIAERGKGEAILCDRASMVAAVSDICNIAGMSEADKELAVKASGHVHAKATARRAAKKAAVPAVDSVPDNSAMADAMAKAQAAKK